MAIPTLILIAGLISAGTIAAQPIRLERYPQKIATHYALTDTTVPEAARTGNVLELRTPDGATWRSADRGLTREFRAAPVPVDRLQYFHSRRYLPDDSVQHIATDGTARGVWVRTKTGVARIELRPLSLREKADLFEKRIAERHDRHGMVADSRLRRAGDVSSNQTQSSDNDGLWTAMYAAAECFRYATTRSPDALMRARKATRAVLFLEEITNKPGLPARSYVRKGEDRGQGGVWFWRPDGEIEWKGDTSSDEIAGHFYLFGIAYDLLPEEGLKKQIAATASRIMDHILENRLNLVDVHGNPTYWGRWSEEYFETRRGKGDGPLNAIEILSFLKTTHHITGNARYEAEYRRLALDRGYLRLAARLHELREEINYSDEELAMLPFYSLFSYEKDPALLAGLRTALDQWWENIQREFNPLWTLIYQTAYPNRRLDLRPAVHTLYRIPLDLVSWRIENSWRKDIEWAGAPDRFGRREARTWLPPDERPVMKWNGNPFIVDGGNGGFSEDDGAFFLLPYWMGRYHKFLLGE